MPGIDPRIAAIISAGSRKRKIDPRYAQLKQRTKQQKTQNKNAVKDVVGGLSDIWAGLGSARDYAGKIYSMLEAPTYYGLSNVREIY